MGKKFIIRLIKKANNLQSGLESVKEVERTPMEGVGHSRETQSRADGSGEVELQNTASTSTPTFSEITAKTENIKEGRK